MGRFLDASSHHHVYISFTYIYDKPHFYINFPWVAQPYTRTIQDLFILRMVGSILQALKKDGNICSHSNFSLFLLHQINFLLRKLRIVTVSFSGNCWKVSCIIWFSQSKLNSLKLNHFTKLSNTWVSTVALLHMHTFFTNACGHESIY